MNLGYCDRCNSEPAGAFNDNGDALCEDCFFEACTELKDEGQYEKKPNEKWLVNFNKCFDKLKLS